AGRPAAPAARRYISAGEILLLERDPAAADPRRRPARVWRGVRSPPRSLPGAGGALTRLRSARGLAGDAPRHAGLGGEARSGERAVGSPLRGGDEPDGDRDERRSSPPSEADASAPVRSGAAGPAGGAGSGALALRAAAAAFSPAAGEREVRR